MQYDLSHGTPGTLLRCLCGGVIVVPKPRSEQARLIRCPSCGAVRGSGRSNCEYCGAAFSAVDKGWATICPICFCRLPNDARYCVECGLKLDPQKLDAAATTLSCPRCQNALHSRRLSEIELYECGSCGGIWAPESIFEALCRKKEALWATHSLIGLPPKLRHFELSSAEQVKYIPCPVCKELMGRHNFADVSGVIIDTCYRHGVWLDNQELNRIVKFIEGGGMECAHEWDEETKAHARYLSAVSAPPADAAKSVQSKWSPPPPRPETFFERVLGQLFRSLDQYSKDKNRGHNGHC